MPRFSILALFFACCCGVAVYSQTSKRSADRIDIADGMRGASGFEPAELNIWAGGQISWQNRTGVPHQPGVVNKDGKFVAFHEQPLQAGGVSAVFSPMPRLDERSKELKKPQIAFTIEYVCGMHPQEKGTIHVIPTP